MEQKPLILLRFFGLSITTLAFTILIISPLLLAHAHERKPLFSVYGESSSAIMVNTLDDELNNDGDCSLREAITAANNNSSSDTCVAGSSGTTDTITFSVSGIITLSAQLPAIVSSSALVIDGGENIEISGNNSVRVFYIDSGADVTLQNIIISNGKVTCCTSIGQPLSGGGLYNSGTLTLHYVTFEHNIAEGSGGAIYNNSGTLYVYDSFFLGNKSDFGGGISDKGGLVTIVGSTFYKNSNLSLSSGYGGAIVGGGTLSIKSSTFYSNTTISNGGALWATLGGDTTIATSTFAENSAEGLYGEGGAIASANNAIITVTNTTLSNNHATVAGGAIYKNLGTLTLQNTIVTNDFSIGNCSGVITDGGYNIDSGDTCNFQLNNHSMVNTDPKLGMLSYNSSSTLNHALLDGSPAIDSGSCFGITVDQRNFTRPVDIAGIPNEDDGCDIGSYEKQHPSVFLPLIQK